MNLAELFALAQRAHAADFHVSIPAIVRRVDLPKGQVDAQPCILDRLEQDSGAVTIQAAQVVRNVPIVWPGAGGMRLTFPIEIGDYVLLVFADRSLDGWLATGGTAGETDPRMHSLNDAVALPGIRSFVDAWAGASSTCARLGAQGGPWQPAGLATALRTELDALWAQLGNHGHPVQVSGDTHAGNSTGTTGVTKQAQAIASATVEVSE